MDDKKKHRNPRNEKSAIHIGGAMIEREVSIFDGLKLDKRGLTLRDYT